MIEIVNPCHPDKIADRIAGALVDLAYKKQNNPRVAFEVLIGHGNATIIGEASINIPEYDVDGIVNRIAGPDVETTYIEVPQDENLAHNQDNRIRAGDNGIFRGVPISGEVNRLSDIANLIFSKYRSDGKYILDSDREKLIICQSKALTDDIIDAVLQYDNSLRNYLIVVNPLGYWSGGINVDSGATNRKLGSDMGEAVTGGGLHGKDLSKADISINIYAFLKAQKTGKNVQICCAIGDDSVDGKPYGEVVDVAREFICKVGGFEKFAEWGFSANKYKEVL